MRPIIRTVLAVVALVIAGLVARTWFTVTAVKDSALETSGGFDIGGALVMVGVAVVVLTVATIAARRKAPRGVRQ